MPTSFPTVALRTSVAKTDQFVGFLSPAASGDDSRWSFDTLSRAFAKTIGNNLDGTASGAFGNSAGLANAGDNNFYFGDSAGKSVTTGASNLIGGVNAGDKVITGSRNVIWGMDAARFQSNGVTDLTTPELGVYIGYGLRGFNNSDVAAIVIGAFARGLGANIAVIGQTTQTKAAIYGDLITSDGVTGTDDNFIGRLCGFQSSADFAVGVGNQAHYQTTATADRAVGLGAFALYQSGSYGSFAGGYRAGDASNGDYSIYIGFEAGLNDLNDGVICIGKGVTATGDNQIHIGAATNVGNYFYGPIYIGGNQALDTDGMTMTLGEGSLNQVVVPIGANFGIGTNTPFAQLTSLVDVSFKLGPTDFTGDALSLSSESLTSGVGKYTPGLSFTRLDNALHRRAGIAGIQTAADQDHIGLAFFTHPSASNTVDMVEAMVLDHLGQLSLLNLSTSTLKFVDAGSAGSTEQGWMNVEIGGVTGYVRVYATK